MKKIILTLIIINFYFLNVSAQTQFQKTIGGTNHDNANSIIQTTDGGYALAGYTFSFASGYEDMYIVKLNSSGSLQWTRSVGGTGNDLARKIIQTTDGGFAVAGETNSFSTGNADFYIVKLDYSGTLQWSKAIGETGCYYYAVSITQTTDGGLVIAGLRSTGGVFAADLCILKLNSSGSFLWAKTYGGTEDEVAYSIIQITDGSLVAAGYTDSFGLAGNNIYILKLDANGTLQWSKTVGGSGPHGSASCIIQTTDGGFALVGETMAFGAGSNDLHIVKLNSEGSLQWTRTVGGSALDWGYSIVQTSDGGFVATGSTVSFGVSNFYAVKLDNSGTLQWSKTYGGTGTEVPNSIIKTTGGFVIAGMTNSFGAGADDIYIVKIDSIGNTCGNSTTPATISGTGGTPGNPATIVTTRNPIVTTPASISGTGGILTNICIVGIQPISNNTPASYELYQNYPNPFNPSTAIKFDIPKETNVKIMLFDLLGREVTTLIKQLLQPGTYDVEFNGTNYPSGVYFYKLETESFVQTRKMVLIK